MLGIIIGRMTQRKDLIAKAIKKYDSCPVEVRETDDKETLRQELISIFDEANILMQESAELQLKASAKQQQALELQKQALLRNLNCP